MKKTNERLGMYQTDYLEHIRPNDLPYYFEKHYNELLTNPKPFAEYMRAKFKKKGLLQQNVFINADISENYGYKLISEEKHTITRDTILRICLAAHFCLEETQTALVLYGMAPLYSKFPRDIVFIVAIENNIYDIYEVNELLIKCNQLPMIKC